MDVFVTGGTGYLGRATIGVLLYRGHIVKALARAASIARVPEGAAVIIGHALDPTTFSDALSTATTLVHLVGTPHPSPAKAAEFERVDLESIRASVSAARQAAIAHLVYVSVAQPAPLMQAYVDARARGEAAIAQAQLTATMLRPWYVLGPSHWWPAALKPLYWLAERVPATRETARRVGLVALTQMVTALVHAVENPPPAGTARVIDVPGIRAARLS